MVKGTARAKAAEKATKQAVIKPASGTAGAITKSSVKKAALFQPRPRNFGVGNSIQPKRDLSRFLKWPLYVRVQRQRRILYQRLRVPPAIHQFSNTLSKADATQLFKLLDKYKPESKKQKKERLAKAAVATAAATASKEAPKIARPAPQIKYGANHVTALIESGKARLVIIAHDVDPIELVMWMPALCRKMDVPYCIVKSKSRLGQVVGKKTATCLAFVDLRDEDKMTFGQLVTAVRHNYNERFEEIRKQWSKQVLGIKARHSLEKRRARIAKEIKEKEGL